MNTDQFIINAICIVIGALLFKIYQLIRDNDTPIYTDSYYTPEMTKQLQDLGVIAKLDSTPTPVQPQPTPEPIQVNHKENVQPTQEKVFYMYEQQGIHLPADIFEEVCYSRITDEKELIKYIEAQRAQWKLEMSKKPYFGGNK